jgi:RimJ/RimL family protein N-acetyltransferase
MTSPPSPVLGAPVEITTPAQSPAHIPLLGKTITLTPIRLQETTLFPDLSSLYARLEPHPSLFTYLPYGPFESQFAFESTLKKYITTTGATLWAVIRGPVAPDGSADVLGYLALLNDVPANRSIEVGHVLFARDLARTRAATEAQFLLARHAFAAGYRRYEWKCHGLNAASEAAALRLGFVFEGCFRQHMIVKGRNRDSKWFSMLDCEWEGEGERGLRRVFEEYLSEENFDALGYQKESLGRIRERVLGGRG